MYIQLMLMLWYSAHYHLYRSSRASIYRDDGGATCEREVFYYIVVRQRNKLRVMGVALKVFREMANDL